MRRARRARLPVPGPACGLYPQRPDAAPRAGAWAAVSRLARGVAWPMQAGQRARAGQRFVDQVRRAEEALPPVGSTDFEDRRRALQAQLGRGRMPDDALLAQAFALVGVASRAELGLYPYDAQLIAARILMQGRLAEMATGEGKTCAAMLAAATAALAGVPVHVVTANPYLAARDARRLAPVYARLSLRAAALQPGQADDVRRAAYQADIVHATASDLVFDYLRDHADGPAAPPRLRGLCMAIIDEADGVLIDEARTPFILARQRRDPLAERRHADALALARALTVDVHFRIDDPARRASLMPAGSQACECAVAGLPTTDAMWRNRRFREELVERALAALHLYVRDVHYLVRDIDGAAAGAPSREIAIIDPTTGRVAPGRRWAGGLHQLVEAKEGLEPSPLHDAQAQLSYQRFFPRYWWLCGMSGTLHEARRELASVYGLRVQAVPLRRPGRRRHDPPRIHVDSRARDAAVIEAIRMLRQAGRPVLVGTDSVAASQALATQLGALGWEHQRLDARQDAAEAARVARAGQAGSITIATNMAGRGTDIELGDGVAERGGLHVISCQSNASARIDRQLHGRAGRGGDPGSVQTLLALDDGLLARRLPPWLRAVLRRTARGGATLPRWLARAVLVGVQVQEEGSARRQRARLLAADRDLVRRLGFGARAE